MSWRKTIQMELGNGTNLGFYQNQTKSRYQRSQYRLVMFHSLPLNKTNLMPFSQDDTGSEGLVWEAEGKPSRATSSIKKEATSRLKTRFFNQCFDKGRLKNFILWFLKTYGEKKTIDLVEKFKTIGFSYASKAGISLGIDDLKVPPSKYELIFSAEKETSNTVNQYKRGEITGVERFQRLIDTWHRTSENLKQEVVHYFEATDVLNPVYMMAFSGARGNISQVRQLVGMRGLMADPQGQILDFPIRSNFKEGLTLTEYIISSYGARKGIVDTALRTANAGYLTRRLVDVAQHVIISNFDCGTRRGIFLKDMKEGNKTIHSLTQRLVGRILARDLLLNDIDPTQFNIEPRDKNEDKSPTPSVNSTSGGLRRPPSKKGVVPRNVEMTFDLAFSIGKQYKKVFVRSPLTCETRPEGMVCQFCYGWSLAQGSTLVSIGEAVGVIAAQSIGEPGTQLTMRTFHTGGVFAGDISDQIRAPFDGVVYYTNAIPGTLIRTPEGKIAFLTKEEGSFRVSSVFEQHSSEHKESAEGGAAKSAKFKIPSSTLLYIRNGQKVLQKEVIAQISSISKKSNATDDAEFIIKSSFEGQFYSKSLGGSVRETFIGPVCSTREDSGWAEPWEALNDLRSGGAPSTAPSGAPTGARNNLLAKRGSTDLKREKIYSAWTWGYAWILSGKIYALNYPGETFFPILGDSVQLFSQMNQSNWNMNVNCSTFSVNYTNQVPHPSTLMDRLKTPPFSSSSQPAYRLSSGIQLRNEDKNRLRKESRILSGGLYSKSNKRVENEKANRLPQPRSGELGSHLPGNISILQNILFFSIKNIIFQKYGYILKLPSLSTSQNQYQGQGLTGSFLAPTGLGPDKRNFDILFFSTGSGRYGNDELVPTRRSLGMRQANRTNKSLLSTSRSGYGSHLKNNMNQPILQVQWFPYRYQTSTGGLFLFEPSHSTTRPSPLWIDSGNADGSGKKRLGSLNPLCEAGGASLNLFSEGGSKASKPGSKERNLMNTRKSTLFVLEKQKFPFISELNTKVTPSNELTRGYEERLTERKSSSGSLLNPLASEVTSFGSSSTGPDQKIYSTQSISSSIKTSLVKEFIFTTQRKVSESTLSVSTRRDKGSNKTPKNKENRVEEINKLTKEVTIPLTLPSLAGTPLASLARVNNLGREEEHRLHHNPIKKMEYLQDTITGVNYVGGSFFNMHIGSFGMRWKNGYKLSSAGQSAVQDALLDPNRVALSSKTPIVPNELLPTPKLSRHLKRSTDSFDGGAVKGFRKGRVESGVEGQQLLTMNNQLANNQKNRVFWVPTSYYPKGGLVISSLNDSASSPLPLSVEKSPIPPTGARGSFHPEGEGGAVRSQTKGGKKEIELLGQKQEGSWKETSKRESYYSLFYFSLFSLFSDLKRSTDLRGVGESKEGNKGGDKAPNLPIHKIQRFFSIPLFIKVNRQGSFQFVFSSYSLTNLAFGTISKVKSNISLSSVDQSPSSILSQSTPTLDIALRKRKEKIELEAYKSVTLTKLDSVRSTNVEGEGSVKGEEVGSDKTFYRAEVFKKSSINVRNYSLFSFLKYTERKLGYQRIMQKPYSTAQTSLRSWTPLGDPDRQSRGSRVIDPSPGSPSTGSLVGTSFDKGVIKGRGIQNHIPKEDLNSFCKIFSMLSLRLGTINKTNPSSRHTNRLASLRVETTPKDFKLRKDETSKSPDSFYSNLHSFVSPFIKQQHQSINLAKKQKISSLRLNQLLFPIYMYLRNNDGFHSIASQWSLPLYPFWENRMGEGKNGISLNPSARLSRVAAERMTKLTPSEAYGGSGHRKGVLELDYRGKLQFVNKPLVFFVQNASLTKSPLLHSTLPLVATNPPEKGAKLSFSENLNLTSPKSEMNHKSRSKTRPLGAGPVSTVRMWSRKATPISTFINVPKGERLRPSNRHYSLSSHLSRSRFDILKNVQLKKGWVYVPNPDFINLTLASTGLIKYNKQFIYPGKSICFDAPVPVYSSLLFINEIFQIRNVKPFSQWIKRKTPSRFYGTISVNPNKEPFRDLLRSSTSYTLTFSQVAELDPLAKTEERDRDKGEMHQPHPESSTGFLSGHQESGHQENGTLALLFQPTKEYTKMSKNELRLYSTLGNRKKGITFFFQHDTLIREVVSATLADFRAKESQPIQLNSIQCWRESTGLGRVISQRKVKNDLWNLKPLKDQTISQYKPNSLVLRTGVVNPSGDSLEKWKNFRKSSYNKQKATSQPLAKYPSNDKRVFSLSYLNKKGIGQQKSRQVSLSPHEALPTTKLSQLPIPHEGGKGEVVSKGKAGTKRVAEVGKRTPLGANGPTPLKKQKKRSTASPTKLDSVRRRTKGEVNRFAASYFARQCVGRLNQRANYRPSFLTPAPNMGLQLQPIVSKKPICIAPFVISSSVPPLGLDTYFKNQNYFLSNPPLLKMDRKLHPFISATLFNLLQLYKNRNSTPIGNKAFARALARLDSRSFTLGDSLLKTRKPLPFSAYSHVAARNTFSYFQFIPNLFESPCLAFNNYFNIETSVFKKALLTNETNPPISFFQDKKVVFSYFSKNHFNANGIHSSFLAKTTSYCPFNGEVVSLHKKHNKSCMILTKESLCSYYFSETFTEMNKVKMKNNTTLNINKAIHSPNQLTKSYSIDNIVIKLLNMTNFLNPEDDVVSTMGDSLDRISTTFNTALSSKEKESQSSGSSSENSQNGSFLAKELQMSSLHEQKGLFVRGQSPLNPSGGFVKISSLSAGTPTKSILTKENGFLLGNRLGDFFVYGDQISETTAIKTSGQLIHLNLHKMTLRRAQPIFISPKGILHKFDNDYIDPSTQAPVITLFYQRLKTGDIVQGIPKVEQFFEARTTKRGRFFRESMPYLLKSLFKRYRTRLRPDLAVRQSYYKIQQILVDGVQRVYKSQGVTIADKHLEIIVKQMTSKVRIIDGSQTGFFPGEVVDLCFVEKLNKLLMKKIKYEPLVLGITKSSLATNSFLSAASFQQTNRVLSQAALYKKKDFLKGLKENIILGNLIPAGTGFLVYIDSSY